MHVIQGLLKRIRVCHCANNYNESVEMSGCGLFLLSFQFTTRSLLLSVPRHHTLVKPRPHVCNFFPTTAMQLPWVIEDTNRLSALFEHFGRCWLLHCYNTNYYFSKVTTTSRTCRVNGVGVLRQKSYIQRERSTRVFPRNARR